MTDDNSTKGADQKAAPSFFKIHQLACENKQDSYIDPETGYHVLTSHFLSERGFCCNNQCRHCPYGFHDKAWPYEDNKKLK